MKTNNDSSIFSRGEITSQDRDILLSFINTERENYNKKKKGQLKPLIIFTGIASSLYRKKPHSSHGNYETLKYEKNSGTIFLRSDEGMEKIFATYDIADEHRRRNGRTGFVQEIFGYFTNPHHSEYISIGHITIGVRPEITQKELEEVGEEILN